MALNFLNGCIWNATSTGTGSFVYASAQTGYYAPSACTNPVVVDGGTYRYFARNGAEHEEGYGIWTVSTSTLTRATILSSSNSGSVVSFSSVPVVYMGGALAQDMLVSLDNYLTGLTLSTAGSSSTMSIAAGRAADSTNVCLMTLAAFSKTTSAWAVGTGNGGIDTGSVANATWYHFWLIQRSDTGVVDVLFSLSASSPTMPTNYDRKRRIGAGLTNGSAQWVRYIQNGDFFEWVAPIAILAFSAPGVTTAQTQTLSAAIPTGLIVQAYLQGTMFDGTTANGILALTPLTTTDAAAGGSGYNTGRTGPISTASCFTATITTNTSAQVRSRVNATTLSISIDGLGWVDKRGRDG